MSITEVIMNQSLKPTPVQIQRSHRRNQRRGLAVVDFALTAPLFFALIFASFEITRVNQLRNTAEIAATEGARRGIIPGATAAECIAAATTEMQNVAAGQFTVVVNPTAIQTNTPTIQVTVTVPLTAQNGYFVSNWFTGGQISKSITLDRER
jgi:Flp pilus assembly protein TadG